MQNPNAHSQQQYQNLYRNIAELGRAIVASYSLNRKDDEIEADAHALELIREAGYPIDRCADSFQRLYEEFGDSPSKSHPPPSQRLERVRALIEQHANQQPTRSFDWRRWPEVKERVRSFSSHHKARGSEGFYTLERARLYGEKTPRLIKACGPRHASGEELIRDFEHRQRRRGR